MTPTESPVTDSLFPETPSLRLCTANTCTNGHEWVPQIMLAKCGYGTPQGWNGCGSPVLMVKMQSCPVCNEPVKALRLRTDHTPPVPFVSPLCIPGSVAHGDVAEIQLNRNFPAIETAYDTQHPPFEEPVAPDEPKGETDV